MKEKTTDDLMRDFLARGGKIQKIPTVPQEQIYKVNSTAKKIPELKTLAEGELLYGEKKRVNKKNKKPDYSGIDMNLIPEHIRVLIKHSDDKSGSNQNKEENNETNKNSRSSESGNKS